MFSRANIFSTISQKLLADIAVVEKPAKMEGRAMSMVLTENVKMDMSGMKIRQAAQ